MPTYIKSTKTSTLEAYQAEVDKYFNHPFTQEKVFVQQGDYFAYIELLNDWHVVPKDRFESLCRPFPNNIYEQYEQLDGIRDNQNWK